MWLRHFIYRKYIWTYIIFLSFYDIFIINIFLSVNIYIYILKRKKKEKKKKKGGVEGGVSHASRKNVLHTSPRSK